MWYNLVMKASVDVTQIRPVTDFIRNYKAYLTRIKMTRRPEVLTVNGVAECVVVDAQTYEEMKQAWEEARFVKAVQEGIASMNAGEDKPLRASFREIRDDLGL
jgi:PHD/YefM family antitoxin component YafN of YafNO toxin-antitoxin module